MEAAQTENKIIRLEKRKIDVDSLKELIQNTNMKNTQRCKSERHNPLLNKINKIALSSNDDKIM